VDLPARQQPQAHIKIHKEMVYWPQNPHFAMTISVSTLETD
jgi:hypothetical protein